MDDGPEADAASETTARDSDSTSDPTGGDEQRTETAVAAGGRGRSETQDPVEGGGEREDYTRAEDRRALYEWLGGIAAGFGIFLTPVLSGPFAIYCALQIRERKPVTALLIVAIVLFTAVFWIVVVLFVFPS